jgi:ABC-type dipeptide/oligopeptide/nickel transport system permease component
VTELLRERFLFTVQLALASITLAAVMGVVTGVFAATKRGSALDTFSMLGALVGISTPVYWLGLIFILIFSVKLRILPSGGSGSLGHLILPAIVLGAQPAAMMARLTRSIMIEVLMQDYIRTARAFGLLEPSVIFSHALRNVLLPVVTIFGLQFGSMLGGAVLTESVFALPGLGRLVVDSIFARDYPVVQGGILLIAATFVAVNLITDLLYGVLDPRIRQS